MDAPIVPATHGHGHGYYDEQPTTGGGHNIVGGGVGVADFEEEHNHEKKPVLKKVKDKVKKLKDTISKKQHGHDGHEEHDVHYDDYEYGYDDEDEEMEVDPEVHGAPMYESTVAGNIVGGHDYYPGKEPLALGNIKGEYEPDPDASLPVSSPFEAGDMAQPPTFSSTGGNVLAVSPDVLRSLEAMAISVQREGQAGDVERSSPTGTHDQFSPADQTVRIGAEDEAAEKQPSYTEKLSSTSSSAKDAAMSAASTVYGKLAGAGAPTPTETHDQFRRPEKTRLGAEEEAAERQPSYTEKLSSTASAAKDAAVSAATTVYGKVAGAGTPTETQDQFARPEKTRHAAEEEAIEKKPSYTEKLSSTASAAKDATVSVASTVYHKVAGGGTPTGNQDRSFPPDKTHTVAGEGTEKKPGYTEKLSSTAAAANDAAVSAASNVYDKVAGAGTAVMGKGKPGGTGTMEVAEKKTVESVQPDKGVSVREFLSERFRPGEEDRALCEVILETMQKREEETMHKSGDEEVVVAEKERVVGPGGEGGGKGMAERIKGAVTSLLGGGGATSGVGGGERVYQGTGLEGPSR